MLFGIIWVLQFLPFPFWLLWMFSLMHYLFHRHYSETYFGIVGISLKSQELTAIFLAVRLYCSFVMEYDIHTLLDLATLATTLWVIYMIRFRLKSSYMEDKDNFALYFVVRFCSLNSFPNFWVKPTDWILYHLCQMYRSFFMLAFIGLELSLLTSLVLFPRSNLIEKWNIQNNEKNPSQ